MCIYEGWSGHSLIISIYYSIQYTVYTAHLCRLIWAYVVRKLHKGHFRALRIILYRLTYTCIMSLLICHKIHFFLWCVSVIKNISPKTSALDLLIYRMIYQVTTEMLYCHWLLVDHPLIWLLNVSTCTSKCGHKIESIALDNQRFWHDLFLFVVYFFFHCRQQRSWSPHASGHAVRAQ